MWSDLLERVSGCITADKKGTNAELTPVCAVLGGLLAQDIVKAISAKDEPLREFLFL